jgi:predicted  nucleic acid-binding Zn-ribbon protein
MDDTQILLQVLNNVIQRNTKKVQDYEIEIANYMTTILRLESRLAMLEEQVAVYEQALNTVQKEKDSE